MPKKIKSGKDRAGGGGKFALFMLILHNILSIVFQYLIVYALYTLAKTAFSTFHWNADLIEPVKYLLWIIVAGFNYSRLINKLKSYGNRTVDKILGTDDQENR